MIDWNEFNDIIDPNNVFSSQDLYIFPKNQGSASIVVQFPNSANLFQQADRNN